MKMIILFNLQKVDEGKYKVLGQHHMPEVLSDEDVKSLGSSITVPSLPEEIIVKNKVSELYCNPETKEVWYEYLDIPKTEIELLREEFASYRAEQDLLLMQILLGGIPQ